MNTPLERMGERRWLLVAECGSHLTVGRHAAPTREELAGIAASLDAAGRAAWLVIAWGVYYGPGRVELEPLRAFGQPSLPWEAVEPLFHEERKANLGRCG